MSTQDAEFGTLERGEGTVTVRFTRLLPHPPPTVWRALTQAEHLAAWFPTTIEGDLTQGAALRFSFRDVPVPPMDGRLLVIEPPRLLELVWGDETLRFELTPHQSGTLLDFSATFAETGKAARDAAGWHVCLDQLGAELGGSVGPWQPGERRRLVHPRYVAEFGPEAAAIGPPAEWEETYGPA
jgi:uncharacterized protein YndB with AHSA1/START domain